MEVLHVVEVDNHIVPGDADCASPEDVVLVGFAGLLFDSVGTVGQGADGIIGIAVTKPQSAVHIAAIGVLGMRDPGGGGGEVAVVVGDEVVGLTGGVIGDLEKHIGHSGLEVAVYFA